jgi:cytochrome P450
VFIPPRPKSLPALAALIRAGIRRDGNLIALLPAEVYRKPSAWIGWSRRGILIVNDPALLREVMADSAGIFPKNDLFTGALEPLIGDSIFTSHGATWRRQRAMIDPAFGHMKLTRAFVAMQAAVDAYEGRLDEAAASGTPISLDVAMGELTADVITRTVFSAPLASATAREVFESFSFFERTVAHVAISRLIFDPPFKRIPHQQAVLQACVRIRAALGALVDAHTAARGDIAGDVMAARDRATGQGFTREELIDQLGVFFLAGHETTASALTWAFFIAATQPHIAARIRAEAGEASIGFEQVRALPYTRNVFRETLRLYPPITFIPRVAMRAARIGRHRVKRGTMIMVAPWVIQRHHLYWPNPDAFDPDRFAPEREARIVPGTFLPFGLGPRICVGAAFATTEATLILARLLRRFDFEVMDAGKVRPIARLTTRPIDQVMVRVRRR